MKRYIVNERIRAKEVRVISSEGEQLGVLSIEDARIKSSDEGLDLVLIAPDTNPPVCKIVDYGQFRYEQKKKDKLSKKGSRAQVVKELKMSPKISDHDYQVRLNRGREFLGKSYQLKVVKLRKKNMERRLSIAS